MVRSTNGSCLTGSGTPFNNLNTAALSAKRVGQSEVAGKAIYDGGMNKKIRHLRGNNYTLTGEAEGYLITTTIKTATNSLLKFRWITTVRTKPCLWITW